MTKAKLALANTLRRYLTWNFSFSVVTF